jgi:signal transduction histidine kinase
MLARKHESDMKNTFVGRIGPLVFCLAYLGLCGLATATDPEPPIRAIVDLIRTPRQEITNRELVRVRGTVSSVADGIATFTDGPPAGQSFCIEQNAVGIWVRMSQAIKEDLFKPSTVDLGAIQKGVEVELVGYLDKGLYAPILLPIEINILGKGDLPPARVAVLRRFYAGADDVRRVKIRATVQGITSDDENRWLVRADTAAGHFLFRLPKRERYTSHQLLDAYIEVTGLAAVSRNWRSEFVCPRLIIDRDEDLVVLAAPRPNPFNVEKLPLDAIDGYSFNGRPLHRRCVEGTVTHISPNNVIYIQEQGRALRVESVEPIGAKIGDCVEVSGFIDTSRYVAGLRGAQLRLLGRRETIRPVKIVFSDILDEYQRNKQDSDPSFEDYEGRLISLQGRLLSIQKEASSNQQILEIDCGDSVTTAYIWEPIDALEPGTELELTGIASLEYSPLDATANLALPARLDMLLRSASDIKVLSRASWWTIRRTFWVLCAVGLIALFALLWAIALRRALVKQAAQLAHEVRTRRDAAVEFRAAIRERTQLAANLHDTILQTITGVGFQLEACGQSDPAMPSQLRNNLNTAIKMVHYGQDTLRQIVRTLHFLPPSEGQISDSLKRLISRVSESVENIHLDVVVDDDLPSLADFVAGNLLLVVQEAVHNAIKHASPSRIDIKLNYVRQLNLIRLQIADDGRGFDADACPSSSTGHFGIESMRQRVERLAGTFSLSSKPGTGTRIDIEVPLSSLDPRIAEAMS